MMCSSATQPKGPPKRSVRILPDLCHLRVKIELLILRHASHQQHLVARVRWQEHCLLRLGLSHTSCFGTTARATELSATQKLRSTTCTRRISSRNISRST